jgi:exodeoxyribonuclease VIII
VALFPERDTRVQIPSITPTGEVMHLMLDIETMGNKANAAIASIGAVAFDPDAQDTLASIPEERKFYRVLDLDEQGFRTFSGGAIYFWLEQNDASRKALLVPNKVLPAHAMMDYIDFVKKNKIYLAWANGATFDHVIVSNMLEALKLKNPIGFRDQIDMRTLRRAFKFLNEMEREPLGLTEHNALDDCIRQVIWLQKALKVLNTAGKPQITDPPPMGQL